MSFLWKSLVVAVAIVFVFALQLLQPLLTGFLLLSSRTFVSMPWTLITSIFAHGSLQHLAYNLLSLLIFGLVVENLAGTKRFLMIFFFSGIFANIVALLLYPASLGASGAVFGLIGFLAAIRPKLMVPAFGIPLPAIAAAFLWVLVSFAGIFYPADIAYGAHLGGLVFGFAAGFVLRKDYAERSEKKKVVSEKELDDWEEQYMKKQLC